MKIRRYLFEKKQLRGIVLSCRRLTSMVVDSDAAINVRYREMDEFVNSMISYECFFAYMYAEIYDYGQITDVMDTNSKDYARYTLAASLVFTEKNAVEAFVRKMPYSWEKSKNFLQKTLYNRKAYNCIENSIRTLTDAIDKLSQRMEP